MTTTPSNIAEALRYAAEDYERLQREADENARIREEKETAARRLAFYLSRAAREVRP